jgi:hypothetical protein
LRSRRNRAADAAGRERRAGLALDEAGDGGVGDGADGDGVLQAGDEDGAGGEARRPGAGPVGDERAEARAGLLGRGDGE